MLKWLHHLFSPHCAECILVNAELDRCKSCETLQLALDQANREKHDLLNALMQLSQPRTEPDSKPYVPLETDTKSKFVPWRVRQAELEANDREAARLLRDKHKEIADAKAAEAAIVKDFTVKVDPIEELEKEVFSEQYSATAEELKLDA